MDKRRPFCDLNVKPVLVKRSTAIVTLLWSCRDAGPVVCAGGTCAAGVKLCRVCRVCRSVDLTLCRDDDTLPWSSLLLSLELELLESESLASLSRSWMCSSFVCGINSSSSRLRYSNNRNDGHSRMPRMTWITTTDNCSLSLIHI